MKVDFNQSFRSCTGEEILANGVPVKVSSHLANTLFNISTLAGKPLTADEKYMAYSISKKLAKEPSEVEITTEEASFLKKVCADTLSAGAYGFIVDIIEK